MSLPPSGPSATPDSDGSAFHEPRSRRSELLLAVGWAFIALKCIASWWLIERYQIPIHPLWIIGPTLLFAGLCTGLYVWRR